ncbi:MAG: 2-nitropropane dioxygenase [Elusimicrobia bacterium RIFOXYA2_FULL_39_19]|nr:MAG: 2-nitropropane dioxygenase [Elusimicrobia bacterium RIFOXYA2_FULL_39_19]
MKIPPLIIGDVKATVPVVQGAMGVRISKAGLAAAVAKEGGIGTVASVCIGPIETSSRAEFAQLNKKTLVEEIRKAKSLSNNGIIAVNIMVALSDYISLVEGSIEGGADIIVSGAGLPLMLPSYTKNSNIKLVPIVSSGRAAKIICEKWIRTYNKLPDAFVVEGILAGGHLGFTFEELENPENHPLEKITIDVINAVKEYENKHNKKIPVIPAGGIFDGKDIAKMIALGAGGVQMATRFVCTHECDADIKFKQAYIDAKEEDITIIKSPVHMPGRVIRNEFVKNVVEGDRIKFECSYRCLKNCIPMEVPYCIAKVLINAANGNLKDGFAFVGQNAHRCTQITSVKELMDELVADTEKHLK